MSEMESLILKIEADMSQFRREMSNIPAETDKAVHSAMRSFMALNREIKSTKEFLNDVNKEITKIGKRNISPSRSKNNLNTPSIDSIQTADPASLEASVFAPVITVIRQVLQLIAELVGAVELASDAYSMLSRTSETAADRFEELNKRIDAQIRKLREAKGLIDTVAEAEKEIGESVSELSSKLEKLERRRRVIGEQTSTLEIGDKRSVPLGGEDVPLDDKTEKDLSSRRAKLITDAISKLEQNISRLSEALEEPAAEGESRITEKFNELSTCLQLLCDRLDSFGQDIPFDRASASPGNGGQFTLAAFDPADSPFGGGGRDGLGRDLADTGRQVQDLSAGFVELTDAAGDFEVQGGSIAELLARSNALLGEQSGLLGQLSAQAPVLGGELAALFEAGSQEGRVFAEVTDAVGASLLDAFEGAIQRGETLSDVLKGLALDMAEIALKAAGNAVLESILGGLLGGGGGVAAAPTNIGFGVFAKGAAFAPGPELARNIKAFAHGGIVDTPEAFAFADGLGIMGEADPKAILPLARTPSGALGVKAAITRAEERRTARSYRLAA